MNDAQPNIKAGPPSGRAAGPGKRRLAPPLWWWIFVALVVVAIGILQIPDLLEDPAYANLTCVALVLLTGLVTVVWFLFLSGFSGRARLVGVACLAVLLGLVFSAARIRQPTGNMNLILEPRAWARNVLALFGMAEPPRDLPTASGNAVDLTTTTPNDFAQFLGPNRDEGVDNVKLSRDWANKPPKLLWQPPQPIGEGWSAFSIVNGFAVTLEQRKDQELISCYEVKTGKMRWQHTHTARYEFFIAGIGPRSTPTIHQGKVYALGATGFLFCLDGATGTEIWKKDLLDEFGITPDEEKTNLAFGRANSPLIVKDLVVIPAGGPPGKCVSLVAYNKDTGAKVWTGGDQQISYSSPALAKLAGVEQILIVNEGSVSGHDPASGKVLWKFDWPSNSSQDASSSQAVPVAPDKVFTSKGYGLGAALHQLVPGANGTFEVKNLWHNKKALRTKFTNVAIKDGFVYGLSEGILECVDLSTGKSKWRAGRYGHGQILRVGDLLLVLSEEGQVSLVEATPEHPNNVLGNIDALEGVTWNNIALSGPYLLIRNATQAVCYELPLE